MKRSFPFVLTGAAAVFFAGGVSRAQTTLPSARELLSRMTATTQPAAVALPSTASFSDRAAALAKQVSTLAPEEAAKQWLILFDAESATPAGEANEEQISRMIAMRTGRGDADPLMEALPAPGAWEALSKAIQARPLPDAGAKRRRELALRAMGHLLTNDTASLGKLSEELEKLASADPGLRMAMQSPMSSGSESISQILLGRAEAPAAVADQLLREIESANEGNGSSRIEVPDLVTLVGAAKARSCFVKRSLQATPSR